MRSQPMAVVLLLTASLGLAQEPAPSQSEQIQRLVQQIKELQDRVQVLEAEHGPHVAPAPDSTPPAEIAPTIQNSDSVEKSDSLAQRLHELHGIQWLGFGEVDYRVVDQRMPELGTRGFVPGSAGNFFTGNFDLLLTSRINDKTSVLSELVFAEKDAQSFLVDLERMLLKYDPNDHLRISAGRYHTGIGYYNTAFHSGTWLQTMTDRPLIMEFADDGGPLPTQAIGVSVTGAIPAGKLGLNYLAEYGSSDTIRNKIDGSGPLDENNGNHVNVGFFLRPEFLPGLQVGGSVYHDKISDHQLGPNVRLGQTIANAHLVYIRHGFEILNEVFLIRDAYENSANTYNIPAFYTQISRLFGRTRPFFRYQYINANQGSVLRDIALRRGPSFGARYDFNDNVAFKTQLDHILRKGQPDLNQLDFQLAFTF